MVQNKSSKQSKDRNTMTCGEVWERWAGHENGYRDESRNTIPIGLCNGKMQLIVKPNHGLIIPWAGLIICLYQGVLFSSSCYNLLNYVPIKMSLPRKYTRVLFMTQTQIWLPNDRSSEVGLKSTGLTALYSVPSANQPGHSGKRSSSPHTHRISSGTEERACGNQKPEFSGQNLFANYIPLNL